LEGTGRRFASGAAEYLADELLKIRVRRGDEVTEVAGEFAEPVQLQIVCSTLWEGLEASSERVKKITVGHIETLAPVKRALADFYGAVVRRAVANTEVDELDLRDWCETNLITEGGTRALVYRGAQDTAGLPNKIVDTLEEEHLIRREDRAGEPWYELSHDKFVESIKSGNRRAFEDYARFSADLGAQGDLLIRRLDAALQALAAGDSSARKEAMGSVYTVIAAGVTLPVDRLSELEFRLVEVAHDPSLDAETNRMAEYLRSIVLRDSFDYQDAFRSTYAGARLVTTDLGTLAATTPILAALLTVSLLAIAAFTDWILELWRSDVPDLAIGSGWLIAALVVLWTVIYAAETFENYPIPTWRRSERQTLHTLSAPFAPLGQPGGIEPSPVSLSTWPLNVLLPWLSAGLAATAAWAYLDWPFTLVFAIALAVGTIGMWLLYVAAEY
jgi:hypothetical protein